MKFNKLQVLEEHLKISQCFEAGCSTDQPPPAGAQAAEARGQGTAVPAATKGINMNEAAAAVSSIVPCCQQSSL